MMESTRILFPKLAQEICCPWLYVQWTPISVQIWISDEAAHICELKAKRCDSVSILEL